MKIEIVCSNPFCPARLRGRQQVLGAVFVPDTNLNLLDLGLTVEMYCGKCRQTRTYPVRLSAGRDDKTRYEAVARQRGASVASSV